MDIHTNEGKNINKRYGTYETYYTNEGKRYVLL
jgi:hypothetical protein